jgi:hypothetical protein
MNPTRRNTIAFVVLTGALFVGSRSALADALPTMNYAGRNICLSVAPPPILGSATPTIRTEMNLGSDDATHTITVKNLGSVTVRERPATDEKCSGLPHDRFNITASSDSTGKAEFCVTSASLPTLVSVLYVAPSSLELNSMEQTIYAVSSCKMERHTGIYVYGDTFKIGPVILGHRQ